MNEPFVVRVPRSFDAASVRARGVDPAHAWTDAKGSISVVVAASPSGQSLRPAHASARQIAEAYLAASHCWPPSGPGPVAAIIVDHERRQVVAGVDPAGLHQLFYAHCGTDLLVATRLAPLVAELGLAPRIDAQALFNYVYYHCIPSPRTVYQGVHKLDAGHCLTWDGSRLQTRRYFTVQFATGPASVDRLCAELRDELEASVQRAILPRYRHGAFLSGGLDSSTVAGYFAGIQATAPAPSFSIGFDAAGYDEMMYARIASQHFGTERHEHYVTPEDVSASVRDVVTAFDEPFGNSSAVPVYFCARLARRQGIERMLAGDGGDELFAGNFRYQKQMLFERYFAVPGLLRRAAIEPLLLRSPVGHLPVARKGASYVRQAKVPLPDRLQTYNFLHRHAPVEVFDAGFLAAVDAEEPLNAWRAEWNTHPEADPVDRMLYVDWKFTLHDNDLVKVNTMCRLAGVDVSYPMLDESLVRFSCRVPASIKLRHGRLRWFYKRAMRNFLPAAIIEKRKHGFGLPFGIWLRTHDGLRRVSEQALASLATRGVFTPEFIEHTLHLHREDAAGYYGELVWILMALELWLECHAPQARF